MIIDGNINSIILNALLERGLFMENEQQLNHYAGDFSRIKNIEWKEVKKYILIHIDEFIDYIVERIKKRFNL